MDTFIFILKGLTILTVNIGFGYLISYCFHFYLFNPRKIVLWNKYPVPFTPGLLHRKKKQFILYLRKKIDEYFEYVEQDYRNVNFLTEYERKIYHEVFPFVLKSVERFWIPDFLQEKVFEMLSSVTWFIIRKFSRHLLPAFLSEWKIYTKLDLLDMKIDIYKLKAYFEEYVYSYFLRFNLVFFALVGLMNMLMFMVLS